MFSGKRFKLELESYPQKYPHINNYFALRFRKYIKKKKTFPVGKVFVFCGLPAEIWTRDLLLPKQARCQTAPRAGINFLAASLLETVLY